VKGARAAALIVTLLTAVSSASCSYDVACKTNYVYGLVVTVVNASGTDVCDAVVTIRDGSYSARVTSRPPPPCPYLGAPERKGTYSVTAEKGAARGMVSNIRVSGGRCGPDPQYVTVALGS
jgi:hypothetical protein